MYCCVITRNRMQGDPTKRERFGSLMAKHYSLINDVAKWLNDPQTAASWGIPNYSDSAAIYMLDAGEGRHQLT